MKNEYGEICDKCGRQTPRKITTHCDKCDKIIYDGYEPSSGGYNIMVNYCFMTSDLGPSWFICHECYNEFLEKMGLKDDKRKYC